jgi:hypothetical protein
MKRYLRLVPSLLVPIAIIALLLASGRSTVTAAPTPPTTPVLVTNTTSQPVPTAAQGTTSVSGTVGISGTPTVGLAAGSQVAITNALTSPVPTRDVDGPAMQPFNYYATLDFSPGFAAAGALDPQPFTVPPGKRLIIEFVSAFAQVPGGQHVIFGRIDTSQATANLIYLTMEHSATFFQAGNPVEGFVSTHPIFTVLEPNTQVSPTAARDSGTGAGFLQVHIAGHYVDIP